MGINSYISHRMFVAALSHDEATLAKDGQRRRAEDAARAIAAKIPSDLRFSVMANTKAMTRSWFVSSPSGRF